MSNGMGFPLTGIYSCCRDLFQIKAISIKTTLYRYLTTAMARCQLPQSLLNLFPKFGKHIVLSSTSNHLDSQ